MFRAKWALPCLLLAANVVLWGNTLAEAENLIQQERLPEAETVLRALATQGPGDIQVRFRLGYVQFRLRKLDEAKAQFESLVKGFPPALESRYFLGRVALLSERPAEAIRWLEPVVKAGDATYDSASQLALAYVKAGQPRAALGPLRDAIQREPWDGSLYYRLGRLHQALGQPELAREALGVSARLKAASRESVESLMAAAASFRAGNAREAVERLDSVAGRTEVEPNVLLATGVLYSEMQQPVRALAAFERAAKLAGSQYAAQFNYGLALLRSGRTGEALPVLQRAVSLLPQSFEAQLTLGLAAVLLKRYDDAAAPLLRAHQIEPGHSRVRSLLATAYLRSGKPEKAVALLQGVDMTSDPAPALLYIEALQSANREPDALVVARETYRRFPEDLPTAMTLGQLLTRGGRFSEAKAVFAGVASRPAPPAEAILGLADSLQKSGEHAEAVERYRGILSVRVVSLQARLGLARSLVAQRELEQARAVLEEGTRDHSEEPAIYIELARIYSRLQQPELAAGATRRVEELKARQDRKTP